MKKMKKREQPKEEEEEEEEKSKRRMKLLDAKEVKSFLTKLRKNCLPKEEGEIMPKMRKKGNTMKELLVRGEYLERKIQLEDFVIGEVAKQIGCKAKKPWSSDFIIFPRRAFELVVNVGLSRLRFFEASNEISFRDLFSMYSPIVEYFANGHATEAEQKFWRNEPVPTVEIKVFTGTRREHTTDWVDSDWLTTTGK